jgi:hypothetical protein
MAHLLLLDNPLQCGRAVQGIEQWRSAIEINHFAAFMSVARVGGFRDAVREKRGLTLGPSVRP